MIIKDLMNENVASCNVNDSCREVARLMRDRNVGFVVVTEPEGGQVAGVVTDRDICLAGLSQDGPLSRIPVGTAMTKTVHSCLQDAGVHEVHLAMREHRVRRLPVLDAGGRLVGVVSLSDLARKAAERPEGKARPDVILTLAQVAAPRHSSALQAYARTLL